MLDKVIDSMAEALADVQDGATILIGGFGIAGIPTELVCALLDQGARELTIVNNNGGDGPIGLSQLIDAGRVRKLVSSYARSVGKTGNAEAFAREYEAGRIELECVPQGIMAERMRAAAAGNGPFFTPTGYGTLLAEGKETRVIDGRGYVLEQPLHGDFGLVRAMQADRWGNLMFNRAERNFNPVVAMASRVAVAQVESIVPLGAIDPEGVQLPGIFVQRVVRREGDR
ncbi:MAG: 3-oxoacid CoA-transferase subunit A [Burkholderiaceae bacterium]